MHGNSKIKFILVLVIASWNMQKNKIISKLEFLRIITVYVKTRSVFFFIELNFAFVTSKVFCVFVIPYLKWPRSLEQVVMRIKHWQWKNNLWMTLFKSILLSQRDMKNKVCSNLNKEMTWTVMFYVASPLTRRKLQPLLLLLKVVVVVVVVVVIVVAIIIIIIIN